MDHRRDPADTGEAVRFTANFLWMCQGYYRHSEGYTPEWTGMETFKGRIVHPQTWPEDLDYKGKNGRRDRFRRHGGDADPGDGQRMRDITMLQRSPTYFRAGRNAIAVAEELRELQVDEDVDPRNHAPEDPARSGCVHPAVLQRTGSGETGTAGGGARPISVRTTTSTRISRRTTGRGGSASRSSRMATCSRDQVGKASVVTDEIERFTENGIPLKSGKTLEADIIVTATGFNLNVLGDIDFAVDGKPLNFADTVTYRGMMFTGVPNMVVGVRLFPRELDAAVRSGGGLRVPAAEAYGGEGHETGRPALRPEDKDMPMLPWIDPEDFNPGYMMRGMHLLPKRGDKPEWPHTQDYWNEKDSCRRSIWTTRRSSIADGTAPLQQSRRERNPPGGNCREEPVAMWVNHGNPVTPAFRDMARAMHPVHPKPAQSGTHGATDGPPKGEVTKTVTGRWLPLATSYQHGMTNRRRDRQAASRA